MWNQMGDFEKEIEAERQKESAPVQQLNDVQQQLMEKEREAEEMK